MFIVFTSFKANSTVMGSSAFAPPTSLEWSNYSGAWARGRFSTTVFNSAVITFVKVPLGLMISAMAAYALSRIRLAAGRAIFLLVLFGTMLPFQVMLAPLFTLVNSFGLINTKVGIILPYLAFGVPYQVFILHGFFSEVPKELSEAALVDGASHFTIFRRIFLPISLPVLAALLDPRLCRDLERVRHGAGDPAGQQHLDAAARPDVVPEPVPERLRPTQRGDRDDSAAGDDRLPHLPALLRLGSDERRDQGVDMAAEVEKWGLFEAALPGPKDGNPFVDVTLDVDFALDNRRVPTPGFYDGDGVYRIRFMPDTEGEWTYRTRSNVNALDGLSGTFRCGPPAKGYHGPVRVRNRHHFRLR